MRKVTTENYRQLKDYPRVVRAVAAILDRKRFVAPVEVFIEMGLLSKESHERWRRGSVPYLERVILCNLSRASCFLLILRFHAHDLNLKPSLTVYKHRSQPLRFTKFGDRNLEEAYSRHFVVVGGKNPMPANPASEADRGGGFDPSCPNKTLEQHAEKNMPTPAKPISSFDWMTGSVPP